MSPRISSDVFEYALLPYCDFATLVKLKQVSRGFRNMIDRHRVLYKPVTRRVEGLLAIMFPDFQTRLRPALIASGAVISGGFLLHALVGAPFDDIDVYVTQGEWPIPRPLFEYVMSIKEKYSRQKALDLMREFGLNQSYMGPQRNDIGIKSVQNFWRGNNRLQVITLEKNLDPWENIQRTFDLDVCINKYDGRNISVEFVNSVAQKQMQPRGGSATPNKDFTSSIFQRRIAKYQAKGFRFFDPLGIVAQQQRRKIIDKARELKARMETEEAELRKFMRENPGISMEELGEPNPLGLTAPPPPKKR